MVNVTLDADFLSAFLKVEALPLVRGYFGTEVLIVPPAVYREVAATSLLSRLAATKSLEVREVPSEAMETAMRTAPELAALGSGEREAIALTAQLDSALLLMNDRKAVGAARRLGIGVVNVPAFLLMYRATGAEAADRVRDLVRDLEEKDHYGFASEVRRRLLS